MVKGMESAKPNPVARETVVDPWRQAAWISGGVLLVFCLLTGGLLVWNYLESRAFDPINSPELTDLKAALTKDGGNEALKKQIRGVDLELRQKLARRQELGREGAWLLLAGFGGLLLTAKWVTYRKKLPRPPKKQITLERQAHAGVKASCGLGVAGLMIFAAISFWSAHSPSALGPELLKTAQAAPAPAPAPAPVAPTTPFPTPEEIQGNWPRFRGPSGSGASTDTNVPASWNVQTGENIVWKTAVPIFGPNSPVIWGNRLFLTGATAKKCEFYCFDVASGKLVWQTALDKLPGESDEAPAVSEDTGGYSSSTAVTDGRRVYGIFANGNLAAVDYAGKVVWAQNLGKPDNSYGHASSLEMYQDRVLVLYDQGTAKENKSKLLAFDSATGKKAWESQPRPVPNSWASPILIHAANREQVITCGNPWVIAYNPADGIEIWRAKVLYGEVTPSPIFAAGLVLTAMEGEKLSAIKPDGTGDVTKTHLAWSADEGLPDITSPVSDGARVYLTTSSGLLTCYGIQDGKKVYEKELEVGFKSSPAIAGSQLYLGTDKGVFIVAQTGPEYKELSRPDMGEEILASPAFLPGRMFVRGKAHLFCIGKAAAK